nr:4-alpha-glucanotransferase (DPE1) [Polytomella parva]|eukprot:CAMPEP_0175072356 /NCGR_PEP_ID=MMETSP0052_2-20121109/19857_1 /TAXON_ID=51329 ORGANISM="Polytomella parva, Strain SAG 63-3" /NCGR_SAMPLE_ID=MMETSP0052_2 /ASSEMBLY_ACC=CAM_ASM_000194 /LENGTH=466 /DNA_ID=CAMNT_0016339837 /DNA_START=471 /DNA_END=1871 /DNA_ORIENTATION=-
MFFSPYSGTDSNCGNPLLISLQHLVREGLLEPSELPPEVPVGNCDFAQVAIVKNPLLKKASARLLKDPRFRNLHNEYLKFRTENPWIEDSAIFDVARNLDEFKELAWWDWPEDIRFHKREALDKFREQYKDEIDEFIVTQYTFNKQWLYIRKYANSKGIQIVGDMPIYVGGHSSDVWANQHLFELGANGKPENVSGVPPDAFSATGQLWGSPLYRWDAHAKESYSWWVTRLYRAAELYDLTRVDHFRGFAGYWSVAAHETTAMNGEWRKGPGADLFNRVRDKLGSVPILAEDLGVITEDVVQLRESIEAPGMVVLQFAWGSDSSNVHLPHNHKPSSFCYTGTHDNETTRGWFSGLPEDALDRKTLKDYFGVESDEQAAPYLIRAAMLSVSETAVVPMQDILGLDNTARMNTPGKAEGNWRWRIGDAKVIWPLLSAIAGDYRKLHQIANRLPPSTASAEGGASNENK